MCRDEGHCSTPWQRRVLTVGAIGRWIAGAVDWGKGRRRLTDRVHWHSLSTSHPLTHPTVRWGDQIVDRWQRPTSLRPTRHQPGAAPDARDGTFAALCCSNWSGPMWACTSFVAPSRYPPMGLGVRKNAVRWCLAARSAFAPPWHRSGLHRSGLGSVFS